MHTSIYDEITYARNAPNNEFLSNHINISSTKWYVIPNLSLLEKSYLLSNIKFDVESKI